MLSNLDIDNIIQPFIDRQEALEAYVIQTIANRVKSIGKMTPSDIHKLERLYVYGSDVQAINDAIALNTGLQVQDIKRMIKEVSLDVYEEAKPYYDYRRKPFIPMQKNERLRKTLVGIANNTSNTYKNLSNSKATGFILSDMKHPGKKRFFNMVETYQRVIDEAIQSVQTGTIDYGSAMRKTLKELNESGVKQITWDTGYVQDIDAAVKRNILDGIKQTAQAVHEETANQFGADGYELTAHPMPAPDHAPFQGHLFTKEEYEKLQTNKPFKDIEGRQFPAQKRIIGQWNCRHFAYPIIIGVSRPKYTTKELDKWLDENEEGVTLPNGKHVTLYEATQYQNHLALKVRKAKQGVMMAKEADDMELARMYQVKVNKYTNEYKYFAKYTGLEFRMDKLTVPGYKRIAA